MKTKRILKFVLELSVVLVVILGINHFSAVAGTTDGQLLPLKDPTISEYKNGMLPGPWSEDVSSVEDLVDELIFEDILVYVKMIVAIVAIFYITILGYRMVTAEGNEEEVKKIRQGITYAIIALVLISISQDLAQVFNFRDHTIFETPAEVVKRFKIFDTEVNIIITFIKYILGSFAVLMIVRAGLKLVTKGGNEEEVGKNRKRIMFSILGLLLVFAGEIITKKVFYNITTDGYSAKEGISFGIKAADGVKEIIGVTNLAVSFLGPIAILMLIISSVMYITSGGEDEKMNRAKRLITATIIGIVIIYGGFALVNTVLIGKFDAVPITATT